MSEKLKHFYIFGFLKSDPLTVIKFVTVVIAAIWSVKGLTDLFKPSAPVMLGKCYQH